MTNSDRLVTAVLTLVVVLVTAPVAAGSVTPIGGIYAEPPSCQGVTAGGKALQGNTDNDTITGTAAVDVLRGAAVATSSPVWVGMIASPVRLAMTI